MLEDERATLLDLLRERLDLTGTKKGYDQCGACAVLVDQRRGGAPEARLPPTISNTMIRFDTPICRAARPIP